MSAGVQAATGRPAATAGDETRRGSVGWPMIRSALWKEWREQRPVLLSGLTLVMIFPVLVGFAAASVEGTSSLEAAARLFPRMAPLLIWPLIALAAGALAIAPDAAETGRLGYLLSRPAHRLTLWGCKATMATVTVGLVIAATDVAGRALTTLGGLPAFSLLRLPGGGVPRSADEALVMLAFPAVVGIFLAWAVALSGSLPRPITVVFAAGVAAMLTYGVIFTAWWGLDLEPRVTAGRLAWGPLLATLALLAASARVFVKGEMLRGRPVAWNAGLACATAIGSVLAVLGVATAIEARAPGSDAVFTELRSAPNGRLLATVVRPDGASRTVWVSDPEARRFSTTTGRLAEHAVASPDGEWIAYLSSRGFLGRRGRSARIHVARADGSDDRVVIGGLRPGGVAVALARPGNVSRLIDHGIVGMAFSADNRWLAVQQDETLYAVDLLTGDVTQRFFEARCTLLGWRASGGRMTVHCLREQRPYAGRVAEVQDLLGGVRGLVSELRYVAPEREGPAEIAFALFRLRRRAGIGDRPYDLGTLAFHASTLPPTRGTRGVGIVEQLHAVSVRGGGIHRIATAEPTHHLEAATGGDTIVWRTYASASDDETPARPHVLWTARIGDEPRQLARIDAFVLNLWVDPTGRWVIVETLSEPAAAQPSVSRDHVAISLRDGRQVALTTEIDGSGRWRPVWVGPDRVAYLTGRMPARLRFGSSMLFATGLTAVRVQDLANGESWTVEAPR